MAYHDYFKHSVGQKQVSL